MSNLRITFNNAWLLLLIIPLVAVALLTFFRINKRFRYTANRVLSLVLCIICACLSCLTLSGMTFEYQIDNDENEVILLVDYSYSNEENKEAKDSFVKAVIDNTPENVNLGVVKFAYDSVYAVQIGDKDNIYEKYISSSDPREDITNIEGALYFARSLFTNTKTAKIVLLTDGIETDGNAFNAITKLSLEGLQIDIRNFGNNMSKKDIMPYEVTMPDHAILINNKENISLKLLSSFKSDAIITMYDNDVIVATQYVEVKKGVNTLTFNHAFDSKGLHKILFHIDNINDEVNKNNEIISYVHIDIVDNILLLQRDNEGELFNNMFKGDYKITVKKISDAPDTYENLCNYDQIILANIANSDMPDGFVDILNRYVSEAGGGLLTIGGTKVVDGKEVANTYNREDMSNTKYEDMLPVLAEDYTPPIGVVLLLDSSGSMSGVDSATGKSRMEVAKEQALDAINAMDTRDYIGIINFSTASQIALPLTPVANRRKIEESIKKIDYQVAGTVFTNALNDAGAMLNALQNVNKKHIILISDGEPGDKAVDYEKAVEQNFQNGITTSTVSYYAYGSDTVALENIARIGNGKNYNVSAGTGLSNAIREDLSNPILGEYNLHPFLPKAGSSQEILKDVENVPELDGFFGAKLKKDATAYLVGEYGEPTYAEWNYGKGRVGSFMSDLNGKWSSKWMSSDDGKQVIMNIINKLFPKQNVKYHKMEINIQGNNSDVVANVYSTYYKDKHLELVVNKVTKEGKQHIDTIDLAAFNGNSNIDIQLLETGLYEYNINLLDDNNEVIDSNTIYKTFSYSKEYDSFLSRQDMTVTLEKYVSKANGQLITAPDESFENLTMFYDKQFDPRYIFISIVLICFIMDIAVRKFKLKPIKKTEKDKDIKKEH